MIRRAETLSERKKKNIDEDLGLGTRLHLIYRRAKFDRRPTQMRWNPPWTTVQCYSSNVLDDEVQLLTNESMKSSSKVKEICSNRWNGSSEHRFYFNAM